MSDQGEVTGTVARRPRKKTGATARKGTKKTQITFVYASKVRKGKGKTWDDDWPEFLERLKALMKRYKITIRKSTRGGG